MLFSTTTEYALRAMAQLAVLPGDEAITTRELSALTSVPAHYLAKVLRRLVEAGLVDAVKGHHGGHRLARPASRISMNDVLTAMGESVSSRRCAFGWGQCDDAHPCPLHPLYGKLKDCVVDWAEKSKLADAFPLDEAPKRRPAAAAPRPRRRR